MISSSRAAGARRRFAPSAVMLALAVALAVPGTAMAASWTGTVDTDWFKAGNWTSPGAVPTFADNVTIQSSTLAVVNAAGAVAKGVTVGVNGLGMLAIANGGALASSSGNIANVSSASGTVQVTGLGSIWLLDGVGTLNVGNAGVALLTIGNGGMVKNTKAGQIGVGIGSHGSVAVNGAGSGWITETLTVGASGTGNLDVTSGGQMQSDSAAIGVNAGAVGNVTLNGTSSVWKNLGLLQVGLLGTGALAIQNGASAIGSTAKIGAFAGSTGTVTVRDWNSAWYNTSEVYVGDGGSGTLAVSKGGMAANGMGVVGNLAGSHGTATIDGPGSIWINNGNLFVGQGGTGTLAISNGGGVAGDSAGVALEPGSQGTVTVDGSGSAWTNANSLVVGDSGTASLAITHGGAVTNATGIVGAYAGSGTVTVDGAGSAWTNTGNLVVGNAGTGVLTLANGGMVSASGNVGVAMQSGAVGLINVGGAFGAPAAAPGTLNAPTIVFGSGNGILNFNHTDMSGTYAFGASLFGAGTLNHSAGWTNLTGDSAGFSGSTHVSGGRLLVNGFLANSQVYVTGGGTLGGTGMVGTTLVGFGGKIAPGNSLGTLNVNGNINFDAGSMYEAEVNALGASDKISVSGIAMLGGGTVQVMPLTGKGGLYGNVTSYNILSTAGGVIGTFAGISSNLAYLDPTLSYNPKNVYLTLTRNKKGFASVATNALQRGAAASVESLAVENPRSPVYQAVVTLSAPQARAAFDQLSGEVHASTRGVQLENSHLTRDVSLERLRIAGNEDTGNDGGGAAGEEGGSAPRLLRSLREPSFWSRAMGSWGTMDGNGAASVKRDSAGFMMGVDTRVGEEGRFGLMGGYGSSSFDVSTRNASGSSDNYTFGAYGGTRWGDLALRGGVAYTWQDVATRRTVAFTGFTDSLSADYKASTTQLFAELGWRIKREQSEFEPFVNLSHVNASTDSFTERGGAASLTSASSSSGVTFSTLGVRASTQLSSGGTDVTARGSLGWRHAFGDTSPTTAAAFTGSSAFEMTGAPVAKSVGVIEAGLDFKLSNTATLGVTYGGQFGSGLKEHSARVQLHVAF